MPKINTTENAIANTAPILRPIEIFAPFVSCGNCNLPHKYNASPILIKAHIPKNTSRFKSPQCCTKSALDKNLKANANSKKANTFFIVSNQPPDFGKLCNHCGKIANNVNGRANAKPNPAIP